MYAIIETGGKQYKVTPGDILDVELLDAKRSTTFEKVLLVAKDGDLAVGTPHVKGAKVSAKVIENGKADKVITFKYKNKIKYRRTKGHRQPYTRVKIEEIKHGA